MTTPVLQIKLSDLFRATMAEGCGNEGYIGIAADGSQYHVVVPVDRQIARGLKAWIRTDDGTPFGGYKGWYYFACVPYVTSEQESCERESQLEKPRENGWLIQKWGESTRLDIKIIEDINPA